MMAAHFITATGTGIGKTLLTCILARQLIESGKQVKVLKPVVSGYDPKDREQSDPCLLLKAQGMAPEEQAIAGLSPWRYRAPLGPDQAAALEGREIDFDGLVGFCRDAMVSGPGHLLIEGVGGAFVPLGHRKTVADWIAALGIPAILVTGSYLGTLSHTISALAALQARGITIGGIVISDCSGDPLPPEETEKALAPFTDGIPIFHLPRLGGAPEEIWASAPENLIEALAVA